MPFIHQERISRDYGGDGSVGAADVLDILDHTPPSTFFLDSDSGLQRLIDTDPAGDWESLLQGVPLVRRRVRRKQYVFRAGQPMRALFLVQSGIFKTRLGSTDGRERVTSFRLRGDLLGQEAIDLATYPCDAIALDAGEVWELHPARLGASIPGFQDKLYRSMASEIRSDWHWMLELASLNAEQRVTAFLVDFSGRLAERGLSATQLLLRMTRADLGSFLAMQNETVVRALHRLQDLGLIEVQRSRIRILDLSRLRAHTHRLN